MKKIATVAIIGKPNVGKSTLFNRLIGSKYSIISDIAGTTRDRITQRLKLEGYNLLLVDTGGLEFNKKENIEADVQSQAKLAIEDADIIIFLTDAISELNTDDYATSKILRSTKKPVLLVVNKCDNPTLENNIINYYELGFGKPIAISVVHKLGMEKLKEELVNILKKSKFEVENEEDETEDKKSEILNLCILGKPNAGKSSLVNAFLGKDKIIVSDIPGTTRDTTDTELEFNGKKYNLIDTAGLKKRGRIEKGIDKYSSLRSLNAVERSDIAILVIDGNDGITAQDCHIAQYALEAQKGFIIAVNKADLLTEEEKDILLFKLRKKFIFVPWAAVILISAKNKKNIEQILTLSDEIRIERHKRIPTAELNSFLQKITFKHQPASTKAKKPKFMYGSQVSVNPPKFVLFMKNSPNLHFSYPRYLENAIRKEYGFNGTAITLKFKGEITERKPKEK